MLIDSHCHLDFPEFAPEVAEVIARANQAGVDRMITISTSVPRYPAYRAIAETYDNVWFTVGTHPHRAHEDPEASVAELLELARHPKCVAIGEAGLDYHYDRSPRDVAQRVFRTHIAAARETGLPLVIHARDADDDVARILREEMQKGRFAAVLHCFTSSRALAEAGIELGLFISFSGVLTFKNSEALRDVARWAPADRLLVETDAPFLAPVPHRGRRNEPAFVVETARKLAEVKDLSESAIAQKTYASTLRLFTKLPADPSSQSPLAAS
jgi:TatD DNase family protein